MSRSKPEHVIDGVQYETGDAGEVALCVTPGADARDVGGHALHRALKRIAAAAAPTGTDDHGIAG